MPQPRILLVEDSPTQVEAIRAYLGTAYTLRVVESAAAALAEARGWSPDAILLDIGLPDGSGFDVMRRLSAEGIDSAVIVITANGSVGTAVEAMRHGARDYLVKPFAKARLLVTLDNALQARADAAALAATRARASALEQQVGALARDAAEGRRERFQRMVGAAPAMQAVYRTIEAVAASRAAVFVTGESGTGKELAAEAVHRVSPRRSGPFVALNCAAIPRDLLESEIFGHVKGAFTGATESRRGAARAAHGGTLFLDEICEMPLEMQAKLLRFVQTGSVVPVGSSQAEVVDVRFVCATNRDPAAEVEAGRFREDLYYRLYVVPVELPPLRARGEDVPLIARDILARVSRDEGRGFQDFAPDVAALLRRHPWPGNIRQLENVIRNIVVLHDGPVVTREMLPQALLREPAAAPEPAAPAAPAVAEPGATPADAGILPLAEMERRLILRALTHTGNDVTRAAALLRVNPSTIYRRLQAWRSAPGPGTGPGPAAEE